MKFKSPFAIILLSLACRIMAATFSPPSGLDKFPADGVVNPVAGTVEMTVTPGRDASEFVNETFFAMQLIREKDNGTHSHTALGLYTPNGIDALTGLNFLARSVEDGKTKSWMAVEPKPALKVGKPVNFAVSWGRDGVRLYADGRLLRQGKFGSRIEPFAPWLRICTGAPWYVSRIKIADRQLSVAQLNPDPGRPFVRDADTTMLANDGLDRTQYFVGAAFARSGFVSLRPTGQLAERIITAGEPVRLEFNGNNFTDRSKTFPVKIKVSDSGGKTVEYFRSVELPPKTLHRSDTVTLPPQNAGFYRLTCEVEGQPHGFTVSVLPASTLGTADGRLAEYLGFSLPEDPAVLRKIGIRWTRAWESKQVCFNWFQLQPESGRFCWDETDRKVAACAANGVKILGVLGYPPRWASEPPANLPVKRDKWSVPGRWKPRSLQEWGEYVYQTVLHYKGKVSHWEVYNEVDFHPPARAASFSGSTREYFELLRETFRQARRADPNCKILISGFSTVPATDTDMPYELLRSGAADYCDIWNMHAYQGLVGVDRMKKEVRKVKPDMPLWQTEQMWFMIQKMSKRDFLTVAINFWFLEKGYDKFFTFGWDDIYADINAQAPTTTLHAFAVSQHFLRSGDTFAGVIQALPAAEFELRHAVRRSDGSYLTAVGSLAGDYQLRLGNHDLLAFDMQGRSVVVKDGVVNTGGSLLYLLSPNPLQVTGHQLLSQQRIIDNPGFEDLSGDSINGIEKCVPTGWNYREKRYDNGGRIVTSATPRSGRYALALTTTGKGKVYAFYQTRITTPGRYRISAWLKNVTGQAVPFISCYNPRSSFYKSKKLPVPGATFTRYSWEVDVPEAAENLSVSFGIDAASGTVLIDDVEMIRVEQEKIGRAAAVTVPLGGISFDRVLRGSGKQSVDLAPLLRLGRGLRMVGGIPFELNPAGVAASVGPWEGVTASAAIPLKPGYYRQAVVLVTAMYVSSPPGTVLGRLRFLRQDGSFSVMEIKNGREVRDWFLSGASAGLSPLPALTVADEKFNDLGLFLVAWNNPEPMKTITGAELHAATGAVLLVAGLTLEKR